MVEFSQIKTRQFFDLLEPVNEGIAVNIELSGCFRNIEVILEELVNCSQRVFIQSVYGIFLEYFIEEHLAEPCRQLIDNSAQAKGIILDNALVRFKNRTDLNGNLGLFISVRQLAQMVSNRADADDGIDAKFFLQMLANSLRNFYSIVQAVC